MHPGDLKKRVERQLAMGHPPEYDRAAVELLLEAIDEIKATNARVDELERKMRLLKYRHGPPPGE